MTVGTGPEFAIYHVLREGAKVSRDSAEAKRHLNRSFRQTLTGVRTGRVYTTLFFTRSDGTVVPFGSRPPHQASAPGEPPARDTGTLLRNMRYSSSVIPDGALLRVIVGTEYGSYLEFGTSKMQPRPFVRPTIKREQTRIITIYADGIVSRERFMARQLGGRG